VKAGLVGVHPSLDRLEDGDLRFEIDFRQVYATLLERWLGGSDEALATRLAFHLLGAEVTAADRNGDGPRTAHDDEKEQSACPS